MSESVAIGSRVTDERISGLDIARAFAVVGMVMVNFKITMSAEESGPQWLQTFAALFEGRAAATFVVLAGVGASLGSRRVRANGARDQRRRARVTLAKRAIFLFVLGWGFFPFWQSDILHYYGLYLAVGAFFLFAPDRRLLTLAAGAVVVSVIFIVCFDPFKNWDLQHRSYHSIATLSGFCRNLFLDGYHPMFPWISFYLFGMWLGRTDLLHRARRRSLVIWAAILVAVTETSAWVFLGPRGSSLDDLYGQSWRWLFSVEPIPPLPMYVAAGAGTAVLVICGSIWLTEHLPAKLTEPLVSTGQLALTIYLAHVFVGMSVLDVIGRLDNQDLSWAVTTSLAFSAVAILFSWAWRRWFARGPLEALMRRVTG